MDLYEYQARDLFDRHGVPVPPGALATTPEQARRAAQDMFDRGSRLVVVKAQVKTGGRGKAGGVKPARTAEEAGARAAEILGMDIKGHPVRAVLVADGAEIASAQTMKALLLWHVPQTEISRAENCKNFNAMRRAASRRNFIEIARMMNHKIPAENNKTLTESRKISNKSCREISAERGAAR